MVERPNYDQTIAKARYLYGAACEVSPVDPKAGLTALHMAGTDAMIAEFNRLDAQERRAKQEAAQRGDPVEPDGWCVWCSAALAVRWIGLQGQQRGVCQPCYAELNRGR